VLDAEASYKALQARDERFDGRLFVGVTSTGVYCRPVCPARPAKFENCRFFPSAAAAQTAGFRPCLRCRPEMAPHPGSWRGGWKGSSNTVSRGLALIADGALDGEDASVSALAERLGVSERQLRRLFLRHLGASPIAVAQTRRVLFAKQLIHDTRMPMAEIALAAGYGSLRRFNESFQRLYRRPPSTLRREQSAKSTGNGETGVVFRLRYRPPYDWTAVLTHLGARAIDGVERVSAEGYFRTVRHDGEVGMIEVRHSPYTHSLAVTIRFPNVRALSAIVSRVRKIFDLTADVTTIGSHLRRDPLLHPLVSARPGLRVPGSGEGFEAGVRAMLGQQISVQAARRLGAVLVQTCGAALPVDARDPDGPFRVFPGPREVAAADLSSLPMPNARKLALAALSRAAMDDPLLFERAETLEAAVARLASIPGVGEWTAQTIALRAAGEPDAFPDGDAVLQRAVALFAGKAMSRAALRARAEAWRPWRAYAAQHLWSAETRGRSSLDDRGSTESE
jgi:AraC family transcriptional regulator, regulatory protein of adaptative response / DNA-3-methyladenine glycosylase II